MRFDEKARENIEAAERLLPDDDSGQRDALSNASASRAYYAAYLAVADRAQRDNRAMMAGNGQWYRHDQLADDARVWGILVEDDADVLAWLQSMRVKADYWEDNVSLAEASAAYDHAKRLVSVLLDGRGS